MRPSLLALCRKPGPRLAAILLTLAAISPRSSIAAADCRFDGSKRCGPDSGGAVYAAQARINTGNVGKSSAQMAADNKGKGLPARPVGPLTVQGAGPGPSASAASSEKKGGSFWGGVKTFISNPNNQLAFGAGMGMGALIGIGAAVALANPLAGIVIGLVAGLAIGGLLWWLNK